jgi:hypothetical protein
LQVSEGDPEEMFRPDRLFLQRDEDGHWEEVIPPGLTRHTPLGRLKLWLISHSSLANLVVRRMELLQVQERQRLARKWAQEAPASTPPLAEDDEVLLKAASAMDFLVAELRKLSPRVILLVVPTLEYETPGLPLVRPDRVEFWDRYARSRGIPLVDPSAALREDFYHTDIPGNGFQNSVLGEGHLNRRGHAVVGHCLAATLKEVLAASNGKKSHSPAG